MDRAIKDTANITTPQVKKTKEDLSDIWTPAHDKEVQFNQQKRTVRLYEALFAKVVNPDDVTVEVLAGAVKHFDDKVAGVFAEADSSLALFIGPCFLGSFVQYH